MDVRHDDDDLARLERDPGFTNGMDRQLVRSFRKAMILVRGIENEKGLYSWPSLHFEKLKGDRKHQRSIRLHGGFRLIVDIEERANGNCMVVKEIDNYHR
jgi:proteic killer suppression protein